MGIRYVFTYLDLSYILTSLARRADEEVSIVAELIKGSLEETLKDDSIREIIETEPRLIRVRRENAELRKQYLKELVEEFKKEDWVEAIIICPDYDPWCETCEEVVINIVPTYIDQLKELKRKFGEGKITDKEFRDTYRELYNPVVKKLCEIEDKVSKKYPWETGSNISVFLADDMLA